LISAQLNIIFKETKRKINVFVFGGKSTTLTFKKITTALVSILMVGGFMVSVGTQNDVSNLNLDAATTQTHMRIYAFLRGGWDTGKMYITYENTAIDPIGYTSAVEMTKVVSDYHQGLFYYDVPIGFDNDDQFRLRNNTGAWTGKDSNQSAYIYFKDLLVTGNYYGVSVGAWVADNTPRVVIMENTIPGSSAQIAAVLNHINSCSTSYAGGYNAWPQLYDLFIAPSSLVGSTVVTDNFGPDTTITGKTDYLQTRYNLDQAS